jgi:trigger factor
VSPTASQAAQFRATKDVRKEVSLPGFRKGHVPQQLLQDNFAKQIEYRAVNILAQTAFSEAATLIGRSPFRKGPNSVRVERFSPEKGSEICFEYEAEPIVPEVKIDDLVLEEIQPTLPPESEAQRVYDRLKMLDASFMEVERPAALEDAVNVRVFVKGVAEPHLMEKCILHGDLSPKWLSDAVVGMRPGDSKEIEEELPEMGLTVQRVEVEKVLECQRPDDDAFCKKFEAASKKEALDRISKRLEFDAKTEAFDRMRRRVRNELIRLWAFDLPQSLVETETEARLQWFLKEMPEKVLKDLDKEAVRKDFLEESKRYLTLSFLFRSLMPLADPSCTKAELNDELLLQSRLPPRMRIVYPGLDNEVAYHRVLLSVLERKCEEYCLKQRLGVVPPVFEVSQDQGQKEDKVFAQ